MSSATVTGTLRAWAVHEVVVDRRTRAGLGVVAFATAAAFGAQVAVPLPFTPVPLTLQTLFVVLAGVMLGPRLGALSMGAYVALGAMGAPVFSNGAGGLPWLFGPTGGYLLAAPVAAAAAGWLAGPERGALRTLGGLTAGVGAMYLGGATWLLALTGEPIAPVLSLAVIPFLPGDVLKVLVAFGVSRAVHRTSLNRF